MKVSHNNKMLLPIGNIYNIIINEKIICVKNYICIYI